jgi:hypothetical protein
MRFKILIKICQYAMNGTVHQISRNVFFSSKSAFIQLKGQFIRFRETFFLIKICLYTNKGKVRQISRNVFSHQNLPFYTIQGTVHQISRNVFSKSPSIQLEQLEGQFIRFQEFFIKICLAFIQLKGPFIRF